jgi:hypothetical protein
VQAGAEKRRAKLESNFADGESAEQDDQEYQAKIEAELHCGIGHEFCTRDFQSIRSRSLAALRDDNLNSKSPKLKWLARAPGLRLAALRMTLPLGEENRDWG